jgi:hypothetical protein
VGSTILRAGLTVCGGLLVLTAMSGTALAIDTAPVIDPGSISSAIALLTGSMMLLTGKIRK